MMEGPGKAADVVVRVIVVLAMVQPIPNTRKESLNIIIVIIFVIIIFVIMIFVMISIRKMALICTRVY